MCYMQLFGKRTSLLCMLAMTSLFFFAEIIVGYITNSMALVADSFHMLSDIISIIIGLLAVTYSTKDSKQNTYGWARAEVLGALANAVFLLALCFNIIVEAIKRLIEVEKIENPLLVLGVGGAGLLINLIGLFIFHGHSHDHHHHHHHHLDYDKDENVTDSHQHQSSQLNMKGVFLHVLGDALGSVVVIASALIIYFAKGNWKYYMDPIMSLIISAIILRTTIPLLKKSALILLQNPPAHIKASDLLCEVNKVEGVLSTHELHIWQLSGNCVIASAHVIMHTENDFIEIAKKLNKLFHDVGVHSLTLQPEIYDCCKGISKCGAKRCKYLINNESDFSQNIDEVIVTTSNRSVNSSIPTIYSIPDDSIIRNTKEACMFSCVSEKCEEYKCCSGQRKRATISKDEEAKVCFNNKSYDIVTRL